MNPATHYNEPARRDTFLARTGRDPEAFGGLVNTPVCRGSTIVANTLEEWESRKQPGNAMASYGRFGTATTRAFESAMAELEGGEHAIVFPSGLAACTHAILAIVRPGDHVLITDSVYGPTRQFAARVLTRLGVEVEFFDPALGAGVAALTRVNTRMVYVESPGSLTFEMQDIPAIAQAAHRRGAFVVMDNTWATPLFFKPFEHGVDISIQAATKYIVGHSDALLGVATANARAWDLLREGAHDFGQTAGPDDIYLALRGLRSLSVRLRRHHHNGIALAQALQAHPAVRQVLHPGLPGDAGHDLWRRDCHGASGLFGVVLQPMAPARLSEFFSALQLFGIGLSWGGYESLVLPVDPPKRSVRPFPHEGQLVRVHAGLEDVDDLIRDFTAALGRATRA
ncbi:cystathionine beta-lyase [Caenimonas aquaedulcis]|uniref:Cystathionine beta-lyase n=1 Tax=Caenimonas aquaedulcis TaxID=2793270 RepID=A0A931MHY4_9BURK|nr:cystathionine beta-lyase [Caenimonas aquaedulcis]MBG9389417.1 cystathionine beta-lyase [Caenimonas aquaedulcis]